MGRKIILQKRTKHSRSPHQEPAATDHSIRTWMQTKIDKLTQVFKLFYFSKRKTSELWQFHQGQAKRKLMKGAKEITRGSRKGSRAYAHKQPKDTH